ncbi:hypothetical protein QJS66_09315 [Kocuria rhizophila]|nr:hypothetical protein QJS66_09315 [Kocuria rhizophila]
MHCADFERQNAELLKKYVDAGSWTWKHRTSTSWTRPLPTSTPRAPPTWPTWWPSSQRGPSPGAPPGVDPPGNRWSEQPGARGDRREARGLRDRRGHRRTPTAHGWTWPPASP